MENMQEQEQLVNINAALAENLGAYMGANDAADRNEKLTQIDYKMVTFSLAGKDYAIDIMKVKEIAKAGRFTYVPNTLPFVLGVYNLRGEIIPIVDLRLFFNIEVEERIDDALENMLIVTIGDLTFGVVVDVIDKVVGIQKSTIQPPHPLFGDINIKYIQGVVEVNNRLYILLDIERIFGSKADSQVIEEENARNMLIQNTSVKEDIPSKETKKTEDKAPKDAKDVDLSFILESLSQMRKFNVTSINEKWVKNRFIEWEQERGKDNTQFTTPEDADEFLKSFYSNYNASWWKKDYADAVYKVLPDNTAKQIVVWNPGCGKGYETYSLACILKKRYPEAKIRIYAHDVDLLNVSNAPLMSIPADVANDWYAPYVTTKANNEYAFTSEIKNSIMFEYHDCANTNALPVVDIIFARDLISFLPSAAQSALVADFEEKLKGNGVLFLGQNESIENNKKWVPKKIGNITTYTKQ